MMGIGGGGKSSGCEIKERDVNHRRKLWIQGGVEETLPWCLASHLLPLLLGPWTL